MPHGAQWQMINGRPLMRWVVIGHVPERNHDLAIAIFNPMLQGPINFLDIRNILHDFLRNHKGVGYRTMQPCPHGQAFVRFNYLFDKDNLIENSPHQYGDGTITFVAHNRAWNNRSAVMTHEVWLMLLGLDLDLWTQNLLEKAVSSFGQLMLWEEDHYYMSRGIVKLRVSDLDDIPWFFVFTKGLDFVSNSWTVQCEVLLIKMLGQDAQDEDFPPGDDDFDPNQFFYHGFG